MMFAWSSLSLVHTLLMTITSRADASSNLPFMDQVTVGLASRCQVRYASFKTRAVVVAARRLPLFQFKQLLDLVQDVMMTDPWHEIKVG